MKKRIITLLITIVMGSTATFAYRNNHGRDYSSRSSYSRGSSCCDRSGRSSYGRHMRGSYSNELIPVAQQQKITQIDLTYNKARLEVETKYSPMYTSLYSERDQISMQLDRMQGTNKSRADVTKLLARLNEIDNETINMREQERIAVRKINDTRRNAIQKIEIEFLNSVQ